MCKNWNMCFIKNSIHVHYTPVALDILDKSKCILMIVVCLFSCFQMTQTLAIFTWLQSIQHNLRSWMLQLSLVLPFLQFYLFSHFLTDCSGMCAFFLLFILCLMHTYVYWCSLRSWRHFLSLTRRSWRNSQTFQGRWKSFRNNLPTYRYTVYTV